MKNIKVYMWDKIVPINNNSAESILNRRNDLANDKVIIVEINGIIKNLECFKNIIANHNLSSCLSDVEVCDAYLNILKQQEKQLDQDQIILEKQAKKIADLSKSNANMLIYNANKTKQINNLNKNLATLTLELAKLKAQNK